MLPMLDDVLTRATVRRRPAERPERRVPGEAGAWIFILGEMVVFAILFSLYLFHRHDNRHLFRTAQQSLNTTVGLVNTLLLLTSSLLVAAGIQAVRRRATTAAPWLFAGAALLGLAFTLVKSIEFTKHVDHGHTLSTNDFWTYYYVLTGTHLLHVLIGLGILSFLIVQSRRTTLDATMIRLIESGASYWHMVDLVWIIIFPLLYLMT